MNVLLSVIVCTFNREDSLRKALHSLVEQTLPHDQYEIIVVDNASTDNTRKVVLKEFTSVLNLRYIYEPLLGVNQARNTGLSHVKGQYVAYIDDDIVASCQWVEKILEAYHSMTHKPGIVTGKVVPIWEAPCPPWVSEWLLHFLALKNWSSTPIILNSSQGIVSCNMACPRELLEQVGGFPTYLGRKGLGLLSMDEIPVQWELEQQGYRTLYDPAMLVHHHIPSNRLTRRWFLRRGYWEGISSACYDWHQKRSCFFKTRQIGQHAMHSFILLLRGVGGLLLKSGSPSRRMDIQFDIMIRLGYFRGLFAFL